MLGIPIKNLGPYSELKYPTWKKGTNIIFSKVRLEGVHPQWTALLKLDGWKTTPFGLEWHFFVCVLFVFAHGKAWSFWFNEVAMTFDLFSFFIPDDDDYYISFFVNPPKVSFACFSFWNTYLTQNLANVRHIVPFTKHLNMWHILLRFVWFVFYNPLGLWTLRSGMKNEKMIGSVSLEITICRICFYCRCWGKNYIYHI